MKREDDADQKNEAEPPEQAAHYFLLPLFPAPVVRAGVGRPLTVPENTRKRLVICCSSASTLRFCVACETMKVHWHHQQSCYCVRVRFLAHARTHEHTYACTHARTHTHTHTHTHTCVVVLLWLVRFELTSPSSSDRAAAVPAAAPGNTLCTFAWGQR